MTRRNLEELANKVQQLLDELGPTLVALAANCTHRNTPQDWVVALREPTRGDRKPTDDQLERLYVMWEVFDIVRRADGADIARAWFVGANCRELTMSPVEVIREGDYDEARISAQRQATEVFY